MSSTPKSEPKVSRHPCSGWTDVKCHLFSGMEGDCNVQPAPTVSCHLLASAGHCIEEEWLPSFGLFPNPRMTDTNTKEMHLKPENYVKQTVGEFGTLDFSAIQENYK